jgi:hypothetical protein
MRMVRRMTELPPEDEQTVETPETRLEAVEALESEVLEDLKVNPYNDAEVAHQRWLETGQTEPASLIPEQVE